MPNYNQPHQFYAGVDLHARSMFVHILSAKGKTLNVTSYFSSVPSPGQITTPLSVAP